MRSRLRYKCGAELCPVIIAFSFAYRCLATTSEEAEKLFFFQNVGHKYTMPYVAESLNTPKSSSVN